MLLVQFGENMDSVCTLSADIRSDPKSKSAAHLLRTRVCSISTFRENMELVKLLFALIRSDPKSTVGSAFVEDQDGVSPRW